MTLAGTSNLPIGPRDMKWDGPGAKRRVFEHCNGNVACISRAFLWRGEGDARSPAVWHLGFCDVLNGRLVIVPRGLAVAAGNRGIGTAKLSDDDKDKVRARLSTIYDKVRQTYDTWPVPPWTVTASLTADATGRAFEGVIAFEGLNTGDRIMGEKERRIKPGAITWEDGPWPLVFDREDMDHSGMVVGTVNEILREGSELRARGTLSESEDPVTMAAVTRVAELFEEGAVGVSILTDDDDWDESDDLVEQTAGRIRHVAIVDVPAFSRARLALMASVPAKADWFTNPMFGNGCKDFAQDAGDDRLAWQEPERSEETPQYGAPLHLTDDGQLWGHCALWGRCHVGYAGTCVRPPKEPAAYRGYLTGERMRGIPSGPLVMKTIHAPDHLKAEAASVHYDHTGYAVADVTIGPDAYGIWVAGALRADASEADIEIVRGSALSGDWREIGGRHRLVGVLVVSAPGFRVARALAASGNLITVGPGCQLCEEQHSLEERVAALELRLVADVS